MHLVDVSSSYSRKIKQELESSANHFIKIYTLGNTRIVFKKNVATSEIVMSNKVRGITEEEINFVLEKLTNSSIADVTITTGNRVVDISFEN
ncbi:DUF1827 family protein [Liquorilactobacillus mali]|uniref:DUF1827 family protein n=1 Tax=Liquorilactobacillus mali TaxID=1618 RepID=UPI002954D684|nr:DUF1827 family protein [Liquorilactobacillus mali]MDV7757332.1 DUF1827 family protein [Liquorilactobacillus mali]